jgi:hypothetical protein
MDVLPGRADVAVPGGLLERELIRCRESQIRQRRMTGAMNAGVPRQAQQLPHPPLLLDEIRLTLSSRVKTKSDFDFSIHCFRICLARGVIGRLRFRKSVLPFRI